MIRTTIYYSYHPQKRLSSLWRNFFSSFFGHTTNHQNLYNNNNNKKIVITRSIILLSCIKFNYGKNTTTLPTLPTTTTNTTTTATQSHYNQHNEQASYENAYFYEPGLYMEYVKQLVQDRFQFNQQHQDVVDVEMNDIIKPLVLLDIGGGTGSFTKLITKGSTIHSIVIDPFLEDHHDGTDNNNTATNVVDDDVKNEIKKSNDDLDHTSFSNASISFIKESAEAFIMYNDDDSNKNINSNNNKKWMKDYDFILLKEVVHHFHDVDRIPIFRGMYRGLNTVTLSSKVQRQDTCTASTTTTSSQECQQSNLRPSILIITRPKYDIDYPLWPEAKNIWSQNQPSIDTIIDDLRTVGFMNIQITTESYPCSISINRWIAMVQQRFWSTFSYFNDNELLVGCQYIKDHYKERILNGDIIHFEDRLVFISASKV